jgi:hypothetical protein
MGVVVREDIEGKAPEKQQAVQAARTEELLGTQKDREDGIPCRQRRT